MEIYLANLSTPWGGAMYKKMEIYLVGGMTANLSPKWRKMIAGDNGKLKMLTSSSKAGEHPIKNGNKAN